MEKITTYYLEMLDPKELRFKDCPDPEFQVVEAVVKQWQVNRFLYEYVGEKWKWTKKLTWTPEQWRDYAENENLRTFVAYKVGAPAGFYELQRQREDNVEIVYFGLAPPFIGKGYGGYFLSHAIQTAWGWSARRVWVHTCTHDHPFALNNYLARGLKLYKTEDSADGLIPDETQASNRSAGG